MEVFLRSSPHINIHIVAWSQSVIVGRGNVHIGFETEVLVVEDISTKHLSSHLFSPLHHLLEIEFVVVFGGVGSETAQFALHQHEIGILFVVGALLLSQVLSSVLDAIRRRLISICLLLRIVLSQSGVIGRRSEILSSHILLTLLLFELLFHTSYLVDSHSTLHQFSHYLRLLGTLSMFGDNIFHHSLIGH